MSGRQTTREVPVAPEPGARDLRRARASLAWTPAGLGAGFLIVMLIASGMGIGVMTVVMEGAPATTLQSVLLITIGELIVLTLPVAAGILAVRSHRAGHPAARSTMVAALVIALGVAILPVIGRPGQSATPLDTSWQQWATGVDLTRLPQGAYEQGPTWPETRSNGLVIAVHTRWTTGRSPEQACTDFTQALRLAYQYIVPGLADQTGCLIRADGERIVVEIHGGTFGSGAVADVSQQNTDG